MRVLVLGGTQFIGRAVVLALVAAGHEPLVTHRGQTETAGQAHVPHLHCDRAALGAHRAQVEAIHPEVVIDCANMTRADAEGVLGSLPDPDLRWVVLSSQDVYRAFASLQHDDITDAVPIDEAAPLRPDRNPHADRPGVDPAYSKIDVEEVMRAAGACVLRLPMVYGPFDPQRREEPLLRRVRAGRPQVPVGAASGLLPMGYVEDVAAGVIAAAGAVGAAGEVFNLAEERCRPVRLWAQQVLTAAGGASQLVTVADDLVPSDLRLTRALAQPVLVSSAKARQHLGYADAPWAEAVGASVAWHLDHPPAEADPGFDEDDRACPKG